MQPSKSTDEQLTLAGLDDEALALLYDQVRAIAGKFRKGGFRHDSLATTYGLTGWAQIHGRNSISWDERLSRDVDYVERLGQPGGLLLDLRILAATVAHVLLQAFTGRGVSASGHATMPEFLGNAGEAVPPRVATSAAS